MTSNLDLYCRNNRILHVTPVNNYVTKGVFSFLLTMTMDSGVMILVVLLSIVSHVCFAAPPESLRFTQVVSRKHVPLYLIERCN